MSKLNMKRVEAVVMDDDGQLHDVTAYYTPKKDNVFKAVEEEANSQQIRVASIVTVQFPLGNPYEF